MTKLNIAEIQPNTKSLGPGNRFAFWVQGCPFNCKGCIAPNWIPFKVNQVVSIEDLAFQIINNSNIDGITISGGEPMMQAGRIAILLEVVKKIRPELNVIVFTGFELEHLVWEDAERFLKKIDVLVAGVYIEKLNNGKGLRGSSNQEIHFLTDRLKEHKDYFYGKSRDVEFHLKDDGVLMVGIPNKGFQW